MRLYDRIKQLLEHDAFLRNSDKALIWQVWFDCGYVYEGATGQWLNRLNFMKANTPESITRARRMIQKNFPYLQASGAVRNDRDRKRQQKGTHIYREPYSGKLFN